MKDKLNACAGSGAGIGRNSAMDEHAEAHGHYSVVCKDKDGNIKFTDEIENLVTTVGKNDALDKYLSGSSYTANFYMGLISGTGYGTGPALADTASSHTGWAEDVNYSQTARPTASFSGAVGGSKSLSTALVFSINASTTIKGCFLITSSTKSGTAGILYSAGLFTGGDKIVASGDTLSVSYTASL